MVGPPSVDHAQRAGVAAAAIGGAVEPAVDPPGDRVDVAAVGERVELVRGPVPGGYAEPDLGRGDEVRLLLERQPEGLAGPAVVVAAGQLDGAATLVPRAVAGQEVAQVAPALVRRAARELLPVPQIAALVPELREECGEAQRRDDLRLLARGDQMRQVLVRALLGQARHAE